jgi:glycerophosphoryl diester phosphodiesterase
VSRTASRLILASVALLIAACGIAAMVARPAPDYAWYSQVDRRPLVIAHQGGEGLWPSSSRYAYDQAVEMGVDVLEGDVHITRDGELVLIHDEEVDRTTNGTGLVSDMNLEEIQALDGGYYWTEDEETYPYRGQGHTIATLRELFEVYPDILYNVEIKKSEGSIPGPLCDLIREFGLEDRVLVASFYQDKIDEFRAACPAVATSAAQDEVVRFFAMNTLLLGPLYSPRVSSVQVPEYREVQGVNLKIVTPGFVSAAHARNMEVHVWTVNDPDDMQRMIALGVDGIITDRPDLLLDLLNR